MFSFNQRECLGCGQSCDGYRYSYTCPQCGVILLNGMCINCTYGDEKPLTCCVCEGPLRGGFCLFCNSKDENSFTYDPNAYSFNDASSNFNHLPYNTYLCELCGNNSHYGYDCQQQFPLVYEQEPSYNQNYNGNYHPHDSPSFLCCDNCGGSHETFECQPMDQNIDSSGLDQIQTPQYSVIHPLSQEIKDSNELFQKLREDLQIINNELAEYINSPSWDRPTLFNDNEEHFVRYKEYLENPSNEIVASNSNQDKEKSPQDSDIRQLVREECCIKVCREQKKNMEDTMLELVEVCRQKEFYCIHNNVDDLIESALNSKLLSINLESQRLDKKKREVKNIVKQPTKRGTRIVKSLQNFRVKKNFISLNNTSQISPVHAITPVLPTEEPEYSLSMGDEHLSTIPETESDEVIKSSVKNLVPIPSEYKVTSDDENECDVHVKDESSLVFITFSNPLFDDNDNFTSSDDESLSNEDVPMEDFKVYSNSLFDDEEINSDKLDPHCFNAKSDLIESLSKRDTLFDSSSKFYYLEEFSGARMPTSIVNEECIRREHKEYISLMEKLLAINSVPRPLEIFYANMIVKTLPISPILIEDKLLIDDVIPIPKNESSDFDHHDNSSFPRPPPEPPEVEIFFKPDSGVLTTNVVNGISEYYVLMPNILPTLPTFDPLYPVYDTLLPYSLENKDKVFKPGD
nr:hypothetical protein [Tanacetum cinerariifolium]